MRNKRGQGLSTNAIILIILGVVVLAVLVIGFAVGWDKIAPWISRDNVDNTVTQCENACATRSIYDFCSRKRELKASDLPNNLKKVEGTCRDFFNKVAKDDNGNDVALTDVDYGIKDCPGLCPTTGSSSEGEGYTEG